MIVFIDDEADICEIFEFEAEDRGLDLKVFTKSVEALAFIKNNSDTISLIISDFRMKDLTGVELFEQTPTEIQKILITGELSFNFPESLKEHDLSIIIKPFKLDEIFNLIDLKAKDAK